MAIVISKENRWEKGGEYVSFNYAYLMPLKSHITIAKMMTKP